MKYKKDLKKLFEDWADEKVEIISDLPPHGSTRKYFRIIGQTKKAIAVYNDDKKENNVLITTIN